MGWEEVQNGGATWGEKICEIGVYFDSISSISNRRLYMSLYKITAQCVVESGFKYCIADFS